MSHEKVKRKDGSNYVPYPKPNKQYIPLSGVGGKYVRDQYAPKVVGPVYTWDQLHKLIKELTKKGRVVPNFLLITRGPNEGKYREVIGTKLIQHYS